MPKAAAKPEPLKKSFAGQHDGEDVLMVFHRHPIVMRAALIIGLLIILASLMPPLIWPLSNLAWVGVLIAFGIVAVYWFYNWLGWYYTVFIVTSERLLVIHQRGMFDRQVNEYGLDKIQNLNYHVRGFQAVLFSYGDIVAQTYVGDVEMLMIHHPEKVHAKLLEIWRSVNSSTLPGV
jgi:hypothetical protein